LARDHSILVLFGIVKKDLRIVGKTQVPMLVLGTAKDHEEEPQDINRPRGNYSVADNPSESTRL
jgi:hypothetical protein